MSSSSQLAISAKRSLKRHHLDSRFVSSKCKVQKLSAARKFPPNCGRFELKNLASNGIMKACDEATLAVAPPRSANVNQNTLNGNETPHDAENSGTSDTTNGVSLREEMQECKVDKIRQITIRNLMDKYLPESIPNIFKLDVEKRDSGFQIKWGDGDGEFIVLSLAEWDSLNFGSKHIEEIVPTRVETAKEMENQREHGMIAKGVEIEREVDSKCGNEEFDAISVEKEQEVKNQCEHKMGTKGNGFVDFVDLDCFDDKKFDEQVDDDFDGEVFEIKSSVGKIEQDEAMPQFEEQNVLAIVESSMDMDYGDDAKCDEQVDDDFDGEVLDIKSSTGKTERDEAISQYEEENAFAMIESSLHPECNLNQDLVNLNMVHRNHPEAIKARETLDLFEEYYNELLYEPEKLNGKSISQASNKAATRVKEDGKLISPTKPFGHIAGVEIGDKFRFRAQLAVVGLHRQMIAGIDHVKINGKVFATSVVNSGRYENEAKSKDVLIYSGQGGNLQVSSRTKVLDQKMEKGNLALVNSKEMQYPIRVTFKRKRTKSETVGMRSSNYDYVYDGLYIIEKYWEERANNCKMVYKFELHRLPGQPRPCEIFGSSEISTKSKEVCVLADLSKGIERVKIRVMNGMDNDKLLPFTYMNKMIYPKNFDPINPVGCDCINGCSDAHPCRCVRRNGVEIPFNERGVIIIKKPVVHECGPQCKCPPTCMNRVSQLGPQYQLEIFKTLSMGWGVRSRNYIPIGGFICEYIGELLQDYDASERICSDEYLFDVYNDDLSKQGFVIDALHNGNIGRFFNHSCSPNLFAQEVLYDHGDTRMPHIMFFAATNIPPLKELTYDYNYKINQVRDKNGNIKKKDCRCGSRECSGRMY